MSANKSIHTDDDGKRDLRPVGFMRMRDHFALHIYCAMLNRETMNAFLKDADEQGIAPIDIMFRSAYQQADVLLEVGVESEKP